MVDVFLARVVHAYFADALKEGGPWAAQAHYLIRAYPSLAVYSWRLFTLTFQ